MMIVPLLHRLLQSSSAHLTFSFKIAKGLELICANLSRNCLYSTIKEYNSSWLMVSFEVKLNNSYSTTNHSMLLSVNSNTSLVVKSWAVFGLFRNSLMFLLIIVSLFSFVVIKYIFYLLNCY